jgi:hypothetical protein
VVNDLRATGRGVGTVDGSVHGAVGRQRRPTCGHGGERVQRVAADLEV